MNKVDGALDRIQNVMDIRKKKNDNIQKEKLIRDNYNISVTEYCRLNNLTESVFCMPFKYFCIVQGKVYLLTNGNLDLQNTKLAFDKLNLPHTMDFKAEDKLVKLLFNLLNFYTPRDKDYSTLIKGYHFLHSPDRFVPFLVHPLDYFAIYDKNLYYMNYSHPYIINDSFPLILVNSEMLSGLFQFYAFGVPNSSLSKQILNYMKMQFKSQFRILDISDEIIFYNYNNTVYQVTYDSASSGYSASEWKQNDNFYKQSLINNPIICNSIDTETIEFLYKLTDGNISILNQFSCLITDLLTQNNINKKLHIIIADSSVHSLIKNLINYIANQYLPTKSIKDLLSRKSFLESLQSKSCQFKGVYCDIDNISIPQSKVKVLNKYIKGKNIKFQDNSNVILNFSNNNALITITDNYKIVSSIEKNFDANTINLSHLEINNFPTVNNVPILLDWIKLPLALHGQNIIYGRNTTLKQKKESSIDSILIKFLKDTCIIQDDKFIFGSDLWNVYERYHQTRLNGEIIEKKFFMDNLKRIIEIDPTLKGIIYRRPHKKGLPNKWAFTGITFNGSTIEASSSLDNASFDDSKYNEFRDALFNINKLIPSTFLNN
ncbi:MAG: hypothetical protein ACK5JH_10080 [Anaerocolumna sp.]